MSRALDLLKVDAVVLLAGIASAFAVLTAEEGPPAAPPRLLTYPGLEEHCADLARIAADESLPADVPPGFGAQPFGLDGIVERVLVVEPVSSGAAFPTEPAVTVASHPHHEDTTAVQVARWDRPLEALVEELDAVAAANGWVRGGSGGSTEVGGRLEDVTLTYETPAGQVARHGTSCGGLGWYVHDVTHRSPPEAPPCTDDPALAARCARAWEVARDIGPFGGSRTLRVDADGAVVVERSRTADFALTSGARDVLEALGGWTWHEAPPCPVDGFSGEPSPFCSDPFFIDPPLAPFTWTFDRVEGAIALHVEARFTPRPSAEAGVDPADPVHHGFDAVLVVIARPA